jgi:hypothetical protein
VGKALKATEAAITYQQGIEKKLGLGYAFANRAMSRMDLALFDEAAEDIAAAEKLALDPAGKNDDLVLNVAFTRARLAVTRGSGRGRALVGEHA